MTNLTTAQQNQVEMCRRRMQYRASKGFNDHQNEHAERELGTPAGAIQRALEQLRQEAE